MSEYIVLLCDIRADNQKHYLEEQTK